MKLLNGVIDPLSDDNVENGTNNGINRGIYANGDSDKTKEINGSTKERIIDLMRENPQISAKSISEVLGVTSRAVEMGISALKEDGTIIRVGPARGGHWMIK